MTIQIVLIIVVLALGAVLFVLIKKYATLNGQLDVKNERLVDLTAQLQDFKLSTEVKIAENTNLSKENAVLSTQCEGYQLKIKELQQAEDKLEERIKTHFELISSKIIEDSREKVNTINAEKIKELVKPLEKDIKDFKEQIFSAQKEQTRERTQLETQIKHMVEISQGMSTEAKNLSNALRGNNKTAGNWGETILENILQNSGLTQGKEGYELQSMLRDEHGNAYRNDDGKKMIPDAIVHFPDNRNVIIDSKVSITAYTDYCNSEGEQERKACLLRHLSSIKGHIDGLSVKNYESYVDGSLDFVMMFIPNDFAAMLALQEDLSLWQNAYDKKILIISPTNLITSLKIVSDLWSREKQNKNIEQILERGQKLYDKCSLYTESFVKIGSALENAKSAYAAAEVQLSGNGGIIRQAEMLKLSGVKSKKNLKLQSQQTKEEIELLS